MKLLTLFGSFLLAAAGSALSAGEITVRNDGELREALRRLEPGTTVQIAAGEYRGGIYLNNRAGTEAKPIVIAGADPESPPLFTGRSVGLHLADCRYLTLRNLKVSGFSSNGINVDDGGTKESPSHHVILEDLQILKTGPQGNHDGLKLSGLDRFVVRRCLIDAWGGSAIDMVGCHDGVIEDCRFIGREGFSQQNGVQAKGGSRGVLIQGCLFRNAGQRAVNIGGSTGLRYFRPRVGNYEAKDVTVAGNRFIGSLAPIAFNTSDGGRVHHNTIVNPDKWVLRILQPTRDGRFKPCHGGTFENNLIVFDRRVSVFVNVGEGTAAETFVFRNNAWFQSDGARRPDLPAPETGGIYQIDPQLSGIETGELTARSTDPRLKHVGADHYERPASDRKSP